MAPEPKKPTSLRNIDITRIICLHLVGDDHTPAHRCATGVVLMVIGVGLTKVLLLVPFPLAHYIGDLIGYGIHGLGTVPFVEVLTSKKE